MRFAGKSVVVLGGNAGIGLAASRQFAVEGAKVALTGRNAASVEAAAVETGGLGVVADMGNVAATAAALERIGAALGGIDVLVVNAGVGGFAPVSEVTEAFWDGIHSVNLRGAFFAIQSALPQLRDGGAIVITGSIGAVVAVPGNVAYAAAKAGLRAAARIVGKELLPRRIRVNLVSPGPTDTELSPADAPNADVIRGLTALGRYATPADIAATVAHLAGESSRNITGANIAVDGGITT